MENVDNSRNTMGVVARAHGEDWGLISSARRDNTKQDMNQEREARLNKMRKALHIWREVLHGQDIRVVEFEEDLSDSSSLWTKNARKTMIFI